MTSFALPSRDEFNRELAFSRALQQRIVLLERRATLSTALAEDVRLLQLDVARIETQSIVYLQYLEARLAVLEADADVVPPEPPITLPPTGGGGKFPDIGEE